MPNSDPVLAIGAAASSFSVRRAQVRWRARSRSGSRRSSCFGGVAMVPVLEGTELLAFLELGRLDHPYRQSDGEAPQRLGALTANRLEELSW